jgi:hypothetical protein
MTADEYYHPDGLRERLRTYYDPDGPERLSVAVVEAVAEARDVHPTEMPPIREVIDLDHLDSLFVYGYERMQPGENFVQFGYLDVRVVVYADGRISVYDRD